MIYTVTLNPAIDKTVSINDFQVNEVNRITKMREDPGGKGINVTKMIQNFDGESQAILIAGGTTGQRLVALMEEQSLNYHVIANSGATRINIKVVDQEKHTFTDINEPGPLVDEEVILALDNYLKEQLTDKDILVLAGSIPRGISKDIYKHWCEMANSIGAKVILDADGEAFKEGIKGQPYIIKPNETELEEYFGTKFADEHTMIVMARKFTTEGIYCVAISRGSKGCILVTGDSAFDYKPLKVDVKSTVGAGDSMVAAMAFGLDKLIKPTDRWQIKSIEDIVSFGVAASSATIELDGTKMGSLDRVSTLFGSVERMQVIE